jgi:hypothetical protein
MDVDLKRLFGAAEERLAAAADAPALTFGAERWLVAHRFMDERTGRPPDGWIAQAEHEQIVSNFDAQNLRVAVLAGWLPEKGMEPAPGHFSFGPPAGEVVAVDRDHINLWTQVRSIVDPDTGKDRIPHLVAHGFTERSIGIKRDLMGPGTGWALFHIALLSMAEVPGVRNMPRLDSDSFSQDSAAIAAEIWGSAISNKHAASELRRFADEDSIAARDLIYRLYCATEEAVREAQEELPMELNKEAIAQLGELVSGVVTKAVEPVAAKMDALSQSVDQRFAELQASDPEPETPETTEDPVDVEAVIDSKLKTFSEGLTAQLSTLTETLTAKVESDKQEVEKTSRERIFAERDRLEREASQLGRPPVAIRKFREAIDWDNATERDLKVFRAGLATIPGVLSDRVTIEVRDDEGQLAGQFDGRHFSLATQRSTVDPERASACAKDIAVGYQKDGSFNPKLALMRLEQRMGATTSTFGLPS